MQGVGCVCVWGGVWDICRVVGGGVGARSALKNVLSISDSIKLMIGFGHCSFSFYANWLSNILPPGMAPDTEEAKQKVE